MSKARYHPPRSLMVLLRSYAAVLFVEHPLVGLVFLAATLWSPHVGVAGVLAALIGFLVARLLRLPNLAGGAYVYNSLLVGLSLGAVYRLDAYLVPMIVIGAVLAVFLTVVLADALNRMGRLPALSLPFVVTAWITASAAQEYATLGRHAEPVTLGGGSFSSGLDAFFTALSSIFFVPHPVVGLFLFLGVLWSSRYLALLAASGFLAGYTVLLLFSGDPLPALGTWTGFNCMLSAMALGGIFAVPGWHSISLAILGAALTALVAAAARSILSVYDLPIYVFPFLLTTMTMLIAMRKRQGSGPPTLVDHPALPEVNYERARLARARLGEIGSVPLELPFFGEWRNYQSFNGSHTHQPPWQHAMDFHIVENGRSFSGDGSRLSDYHCFDLPVVSPGYGQVVSCRHDLYDNPPGEVDTRNNWGNFVLVRLSNGLHVLLAHLRHGSLVVDEGAWVTPRMVLARCGNSGRSPQPHLHLQVQVDSALGRATHPFHLTSVLARSAKTGRKRFYLFRRPQEGERVQAAKRDDRFARPLRLAVGRCLHYRVQMPRCSHWVDRRLCVQLTPLGQFQLVADTGASAAFEEGSGVMVFYDRNGPKDEFFDMWLLAMGLTPLTEAAQDWHDAPCALLLPLHGMRRLLLALLWPWGTGLDSHYQRWRDEDGRWHQRGTHKVVLASRLGWQCISEAAFSSRFGCVRLAMEMGSRRWQAVLQEVGQMADSGIPSWREQVPDVFSVGK